MKSSSIPIILILLFVLLLQTFTPTIKSLVAKIEYAALSEKEISHEILVEPTSFLERLSARDILKFKPFAQYQLLPIVEGFDRMDSIIIITIESDNHDFFEIIEYSDSLSLILSIQKKETENKNFKDIIDAIEYDFDNIKEQIGKTEKAEDLLLAKSRLRNLKNGIFSLVLNILDKGERDNKAVAIQEYLIQSLGEKSKNLIDDKPYFSLPPEYSQEKEKEIFESIKLSPHNPLGMIALAQLYIEMRNITDAQIIYRNYIAPLQNLPEDLAVGKRLIEEQIKDFNSKRINANLIEAKIEVKESGNAGVYEEYELIGETLGKEVVVLLPFIRENFTIVEVKDQANKDISELNLRSSWKSSTVLTIREGHEIDKIYLRYEVSDFLKYKDEFGKFVFRYGGVSTSRRMICNVTIPTMFAVTNLEQGPLDTKESDDDYQFKWVNPTLQYKISPIKYVGVKNGIAGEIVSVWLINKRYSFTLLIFVLFLILSGLSNKWLPELWGKFVYLILALFVVVYVMNDIQVVQAYGSFFDSFSNFSYRIISGGLLLIFIVLADRPFKGDKYWVTTMCIFEFALVTLFLKLFYDNANFSNKWFTAIILFSLLSYLNSLLTQLAEKLKYSKLTLMTVIVIVFSVFYFVSKNVELFKFSKFTLNVIGYIFGGLILILLAVFFIASERLIINERDKSLFARVFEWIRVTIEPIAEDGSKILLVLLVVITFFFNSTIIASLLALVGAFMSDFLKSVINYDSLLKKKNKNTV
jgi:hypothetical protein